MEPTLVDNQYLIVNKLVYFNPDTSSIFSNIPFLSQENLDRTFIAHRPRRNELVVFRYPGDESTNFVKRIIGIPGDTIEIINGNVYVNDSPIHESYVPKEERAKILYSMDQVIVKPMQYFVLGDNRKTSNDSRNGWMLPAENIIGKAWISYWPFSKFSFL